MLVWFISHLCRFTFCSCAWSSLFGVSMNAREVPRVPVGTAPVCSSIHFLGYVVDVFFLHRGGQWIPNPFKSRLNSLSISLLSIGRNLSRLIWAPPDPMSYACRARLTCSTVSARSRWFFSPSAATGRSLSGITPLLSKTSYRSRAPRSKPPVSTARVLPLHFSTFRLSARGSLSPNVTKGLRLPHFSPVFPTMHD